MQITSKRLVSIMLVLAFALAMLPMAVFAADTEYYLRGSMNGWIAGDSNKMTLQDDGTYAITMDLAAGTYEFKGAVADWSWSCPGGSNMSLTLEADDTVTFVLNPTANSLTYTLASGTVVETAYYLRGSMNNWGIGNPMTKNEDGTYSVTISLEAGSYEYKAAVEDWSWSCPGGSNATLVLEEATDVTFTLDLTANTLTTSVESAPLPALEVNTVTAVGAGSGNFLYGITWDPSASVNYAYSTEEAPKVYSVTYNAVAAGSYEFKFAANGTWDITWGTGAECVSGESYDAYLSGGNSIVTVAEDNSTVTLTLDLSAVDAAGNGAKMSVLVEATAGGDLASSAPAALVLGDNSYTIAIGDTAAVSSTYTVEEDGILAIKPTYMNTFDAYFGEWSEVPAAYIPMQFGRSYALLVNGQQVWLPCEIEVAAGDVVEIGLQSYMGNGTEVTVNLSMVEPTVNYYVAGSEGLCGVEWDPAEATNMMYFNDQTGLYEITFGAEAGTYEYKITTGSWDVSYGNADGGNMIVTVKNSSSVFITFNPETYEITCTVTEYGIYDLKFQLNAGASANDDTVDLRMITYVDSLDYSSVTFDITINGMAAVASCDTVYTGINSNGSVLTCEDIFGFEGYLVTYTLKDIPADFFFTDIQVTANFQPLEGDAWTSNGRTIVLSDILN